MVIRQAELSDEQSLLDIYNYEVLHGTATFDLHSKTLEERREWLVTHNQANHPLWVAQEEEVVTGYVSLSPYREKEAYAATVELSLYVHRDHRRKGIAVKLMEAILQYARECQAIHTVISVITSDNAASIRLHERFGFTCCGRIKEVGYKFERYLDIINYQLMV